MTSKTINLSGLKPEQIEQIQAIIEAFQAKNQLEILAKNRPEELRKPISGAATDLIDVLTENPIKVNGFLTREEIYER